MRPIASAWEAGSGGVNFTLSFSAPSSFWRQAGLAVSTWGGLMGENDFKKERDALPGLLSVGLQDAQRHCNNPWQSRTSRTGVFFILAE